MNFFDKKKDETIFSKNPTFFKNLGESSSSIFSRNKENLLFLSETNINKDGENMNKEYEMARKNLKKVSNSLFFDDFPNNPSNSSDELHPPALPPRKQPNLPPNKPYYPFLHPPSHAPPSLHIKDEYLHNTQNFNETLTSVHNNYDNLSKPQKQALKTNISHNMSKSTELLSSKKTMRNIMDKTSKPKPPTKPSTLKLEKQKTVHTVNDDFSNMSKSEIYEKKNTSTKSEENLLDLTDSFKDIKKSLNSLFTKSNEPFKTYIKQDDHTTNSKFSSSTNMLDNFGTNNTIKNTHVSGNTTNSTKIKDNSMKSNINNKSNMKPGQNKPSNKPPRPTEGPKFFINSQDKGPRGRALYDFDSDHPDDLPFKTGDIVFLDEEIDESWYKGHLKHINKTGIFPANYIEVIEPIKKNTYNIHNSNDYGIGNNDNYKNNDYFGGDVNYGGGGNDDVYGNVDNETQSTEGFCAIALYDFEGIVDNGEISLKQGDWLEQVEVATDDWMRGLKSNGDYGLFPASFVEISNETRHKEEIQPKNTNKTINPKIERATTPTIATVTALYDFNGEQEGDLMFKTGDMIEVKKRINDDWLEGCLNGKVGLFPASFVSSY